MGMRKIDVLLGAYDAHYQTDLGRRLLFLCVPVFLFGFFGLVYAIPVYLLFTSIFEPSVTKHINLASLLLVVVTLYYLSLSVKLALGLLFLLLLALAVIHVLELSGIAPLWLMMMIIFISAWLGLFLAHRHEAKALSYLAGVQCLLIGPLWVLRQVYNRLGIRV